ncbi:MAG: methyl-accepting chemotaxis protein [Myxococcota bacterium]|nr:methyl-accepting chemotaxis protein [Myxococcota bacterium]
MTYWTTTLTYMCFAVAMWVGAYHLMLYIKQPIDRANHSFAMLCFAMAAYDFCSAGLYASTTNLQGARWQQGQLFSAALITYAIGSYINDTFKFKARKRLIGIGIILGTVAIVNHFTSLGVDFSIPTTKHIDWLGLTIYECKLGEGTTALFAIIIFCISYVFYTVLKHYRQGEKNLKFVVISIGLFFIMCVNDILVGENVYASVYLIEYGFFFVLVAMAARLQTLFTDLFKATDATGKRQAALLTTIKEVQPEIQHVVADLTAVSQSVATQASEHAITANNVGTSIERVKQTADEMSTAAIQSRNIAEETNASATTSANNLKHVAKRFSQTMPIIEQLESEIGNLATKIGNTEEILTFIQEIAQQINILAINAGIQAVHAGKKGKGFRVIATELREMIQVIEDYLTRSHGLLTDIRRQAHGSTVNTRETTRLIGNQVAHLSSVEAAIGSISSAFGEASRHVDVIAEASQKQKLTIHEVAASVDQLKTAADYLSTSAANVISNMERLVLARKTLDGLMDEIGDLVKK